jgi:uncharacterized protein YbaR (Trm112 family)
MRKSILPVLACPECKGELELKVNEESDDEVTTGVLICKTCNKRYPIVKGIPNFIPEHIMKLKDD